MTVRFWHPPRTGGSSLKRAWGMGRVEANAHRFPPADKPAGEWWYGFTRSPWDRVVSLWCLAWPTDDEREAHPFREWVLGGMVVSRHDPEKWQRYASPTARWLDRCDYVGRFENRDDDIRELCRILDRPFPMVPDATHGEVPAWFGRSRDRTEYPDYYDDETRVYVGERYAEDVEAFGYTFWGETCAV